MQMTWTVFVNTRTEPKARNVLKRLADGLGREPEQSSFERFVLKEPEKTTYLFILAFSLHLQSSTWNDAVVEAITLGQRVGSMWKLSGDVTKDVVARTSFARLGGVASLEYRLSDSTS